MGVGVWSEEVGCGVWGLRHWESRSDWDQAQADNNLRVRNFQVLGSGVLNLNLGHETHWEIRSHWDSAQVENRAVSRD